jgi:hypothetical protein
MASHRPNTLFRASMGRNRRTWWYSLVATPAAGSPQVQKEGASQDEGAPETGERVSEGPNIS